MSCAPSDFQSFRSFRNVGVSLPDVPAFRCVPEQSNPPLCLREADSEMSDTVREAARQQAIRFAKAYYREHRSAPPVRVILRNCGLVKSTRHFYRIFPGRVDELCKVVGIPPPADRLRITEKAGLMRRQGGAEESGPKLDAKIFQLLEKGTPLPSIVSLLGHPDRVLELHGKRRRLKEADIGQPIVPEAPRTILSEVSALKHSGSQLSESIGGLQRRLAVLENNFSACFTLRECPYCHALTPVPRFAKSYFCISCGKELGQTYTQYTISREGRGVEYTGEFPNPPR